MSHLLAIGQYVQTHLGAVLLAVVASFAVGFLWHGPLFGRQWMTFNNIAMPKKGEATFGSMVPGIVASLLMAFVQAAVLGRVFEIVTLAGMGQALLIAAILWLPFSALVLANEYAWLGKSFAHICFDALYNLASILAIAAVLYAMM